MLVPIPVVGALIGALWGRNKKVDVYPKCPNCKRNYGEEGCSAAYKHTFET